MKIEVNHKSSTKEEKERAKKFMNNDEPISIYDYLERLEERIDRLEKQLEEQIDKLDEHFKSLT